MNLSENKPVNLKFCYLVQYYLVYLICKSFSYNFLTFFLTCNSLFNANIATVQTTHPTSQESCCTPLGLSVYPKLQGNILFL